MPDAMTMEIEGLDELVKTFGKYFSDIDTSPILFRAMAKIGKEVEAGAKDLLQEKIYNTPEGWYKRTGLLKANTVSDEPVGGNKELSVIVRSKQYYAPYVEFGRGRMRARAFLLPAAQMKADRATEIIKEALREFLETKITL